MARDKLTAIPRMSSNAPNLHVRMATADELPKLLDIALESFGHNPYSQAIFSNATDEERLTQGRRWREDRYRANFEKPGQHYLVVVQAPSNRGDREEIAGWALWQQPRTEVDPDAAGGQTPKTVAPLPSIINGQAIEARERALTDAYKKAFGEDGMRRMWAADIVVVDPRHRRKGVGSMLMRWGLDKAKKSETDAYIVATDIGRDMYLTVGFQDVFRFWTGVDYNWLMVWRRNMEI
ncbi:uncharacterized protein PgNI_02576 [Pyricularia grisea]|uniref:N-acetyltransferase domain-containing protein n=1 Tax=Pyricularia grisea TaxID=148305 RepID=A0A6P8BM61_PYRGI|nr:uncharacterized protein PgNI_02576 [Pyricularia grisea]TLD17976.1 hypothetical protein PgNI_02576 [Pyricularia grisea]